MSLNLLVGHFTATWTRPLQLKHLSSCLGHQDGGPWQKFANPVILGLWCSRLFNLKLCEVSVICRGIDPSIFTFSQHQVASTHRDSGICSPLPLETLMLNQSGLRRWLPAQPFCVLDLHLDCLYVVGCEFIDQLPWSYLSSLSDSSIPGGLTQSIRNNDLWRLQCYL